MALTWHGETFESWEDYIEMKFQDVSLYQIHISEAGYQAEITNSRNDTSILFYLGSPTYLASVHFSNRKDYHRVVSDDFEIGGREDNFDARTLDIIEDYLEPVINEGMRVRDYTLSGEVLQSLWFIPGDDKPLTKTPVISGCLPLLLAPITLITISMIRAGWMGTSQEFDFMPIVNPAPEKSDSVD